jgi:hypothetical protein
MVETTARIEPAPAQTPMTDCVKPHDDPQPEAPPLWEQIERAEEQARCDFLSL